ncbi:MAG: hypothetical protein IKX83_02600, partial [Clostridia bacterium]|nr:hypothetical protein [Clostridia bacterium]
LYGKIAPKFDAEEIKAKAAAEKAAAAEAVVETAEAVEAPVEAAVVETVEVVEAPVEAVENPVLETAAPTDFEVLFDVPVEGSEN